MAKSFWPSHESRNQFISSEYVILCLDGRGNNIFSDIKQRRNIMGKHLTRFVRRDFTRIAAYSHCSIETPANHNYTLLKLLKYCFYFADTTSEGIASRCCYIENFSIPEFHSQVCRLCVLSRGSGPQWVLEPLKTTGTFSWENSEGQEV